MTNSLIDKLLKQYVDDIPGILTVLVYERNDYSLLSYFDNINLNEPQFSTQQSLLNQYIDEIEEKYEKKYDFLVFKEFENNKLVFCSTDSFSTIVTIAEKEVSDIDLKIYSVYIAGEIERISGLEFEKPNDLQLKTPSIIRLYSKVKKIKQITKKLVIKIVVVGDYKAGKTSLINRFTEKKFSTDLNSTAKFNVIKKVLNIDDNIIMNLAIWDTGGLSSQISPTKEKIYKFVDAVLIVLDFASDRRLKSIEKWYNEIVESTYYEIPIFLAVTKNDMNSGNLNSSLQDIEEITRKYHIEYLPVSAKTGENIDNMFYEIIYKIISSKSDNGNMELVEDIHKYKGYYLEQTEIKALKDLEQLIIESLGIQSEYLHAISKKIKENGFPIIFEIEGTSFGIKIENSTVTGLGLFNCYLSTLPKSIISFKSLKKLSLRSNQLIRLPYVITELESLEMLDLALTDLTIIPKSLGSMKNLKTLHLENNALMTLPVSIGDLKSLEEIFLENNPIKSLPESICNLSNLKKLYLEAPTYFYKGNLNDLPYNFGKLTSLQELDLSSCNLKHLPKTFGNLLSLRILDLYNNKLTSLPDTFGNLKLLEILNLEKNNIKFLPNSLGKLSNLKSIRVSKNPLQKKGSEKFKALALKSKGIKYERLMQLSKICKQEETAQKIQKIGIEKKKISNIIKPLTYSSVVALLGIITFLSFRINSQELDITILTLFSLALFINILIGTCIIATISSYFKVSTILLSQKLIKVFDIFVIFYFVWALRALLKTILAIEFIPSINFLFEFSVPEWMLNYFVEFGYNINLTFLDNIDLFFEHFYFKIFSIALVFWALYRNGFTHIRKTIFDEKTNKNLWFFLIIGLFGALSLAIMDYSNLQPFLDIGYNIGVIVGSCLFIWEINRIKKAFFYYYLLLIISGILLIWCVSNWSDFYSILISLVLICLFLIMRMWHHKKVKYYIY
ncbi:MAG: GTP-binding protein [Promethearchaeota archaeon]